MAALKASLSVQQIATVRLLARRHYAVPDAALAARRVRRRLRGQSARFAKAIRVVMGAVDQIGDPGQLPSSGPTTCMFMPVVRYLPEYNSHGPASTNTATACRRPRLPGGSSSSAVGTNTAVRPPAAV